MPALSLCLRIRAYVRACVRASLHYSDIARVPLFAEGGVVKWSPTPRGRRKKLFMSVHTLRPGFDMAECERADKRGGGGGLRDGFLWRDYFLPPRKFMYIFPSFYHINSTLETKSFCVLWGRRIILEVALLQLPYWIHYVFSISLDEWSSWDGSEVNQVEFDCGNTTPFWRYIASVGVITMLSVIKASDYCHKFRRTKQ